MCAGNTQGIWLWEIMRVIVERLMWEDKRVITIVIIRELNVSYKRVEKMIEMLLYDDIRAIIKRRL